MAGHFLPDYLEGRQATPRIGSLDLKSYLFRTVLSSIVIFNVLLMLRDFQTSKGSLNPTLAVVCAMQVRYGNFSRKFKFGILFNP